MRSETFIFGHCWFSVEEETQIPKGCHTLSSDSSTRKVGTVAEGLALGEKRKVKENTWAEIVGEQWGQNERQRCDEIL